MTTKFVAGFIVLKSGTHINCNHNVTRNSIIYQLFLIYIRVQRRRLKSAIKARKLTESLEIIESLGFSDELALFFIANIQNMEGI